MEKKVEVIEEADKNDDTLEKKIEAVEGIDKFLSAGLFKESIVSASQESNFDSDCDVGDDTAQILTPSTNIRTLKTIKVYQKEIEIIVAS